MLVPHRWVYFCLVFFLAVGRLSAAEVSLGKVQKWYQGTLYGETTLYQDTETGGLRFESWGTDFTTSLYVNGEYVSGGFVPSFVFGVPPAGATGGLLKLAGNLGTSDEKAVTFINAGPSPKNKVAITIPANNSAYPVEYALVQDGVEVGTLVQLPGASARIFSQEVPAGSSVSVVARVQDVAFTDGQWIEQPGVVTPLNPNPVATVTPSEVPSGGPDPEAQPVDTPETPSGPQPDTPSPTKPVWSGNSGSQTDLLTNTVYREGVTKIWEKLSDVAETLEKLDERGEDAKTDGEARVEEIEDAHDNAVSSAEAQRTAKAQEAAAQFPVLTGRDEGSFPSNASAPNFTIAFMGHTFDCDPFRSDRFGPFADWLKAALAWLCVVTFAIWCSSRMAESVRAMAAAQQGRGVQVQMTLAGFGGGTTAPAALIVAGVITTAAFVLVPALVSWYSYDLGLYSVVSAMGANPMSSAPAGIVYVIERVFPLATLFACLVSMVAYNLTSSAAFAAFATVVRWCLS